MLANRTSNPPSLRLRTPESTARVLRAHVARHNRRVLLLAGGTLLAAAAAWLLLYFICTWLFVFGLTIFELPFGRIPRGFGIVFAVAAACAILYAWIDQRLTPNERARDEKRPSEIVEDLVLLVPRMTLSVSGTLAAWQHWEPGDFAQAAMLLHRLAEEKRLPMSSVRLDIPDASAALRILFGLQLTQVIEVQREGQEFLLKLNALRPDTLRLTGESYADA